MNVDVDWSHSFLPDLIGWVSWYLTLGLTLAGSLAYSLRDAGSSSRSILIGSGEECGVNSGRCSSMQCADEGSGVVEVEEYRESLRRWRECRPVTVSVYRLQRLLEKSGARALEEILDLIPPRTKGPVHHDLADLHSIR